MCEAAHLVRLENELDALFELIMKEDEGTEQKWNEKRADLASRLLKAARKEQKAVVKEIVSAILAKGDAPITQSELNNYGNLIQTVLGDQFAALTSPIVESVTNEAYVNAGKEITEPLSMKFEFNKTSKKTIEALHTDITYWIGEHYDKELNLDIRKQLNKAMSEGMNRLEAGEQLRTGLLTEFKKRDGYWEGLANHIITRTREFGHVDAYEQAGIEKVEIEATLDGRTSEICKALHGRVITVKKLVKQRDAFITADSPEDAKKIAPFYSDKMTEEKVKDKDKLPGDIGLPPYHWYCRTRTKPVFKK